MYRLSDLYNSENGPTVAEIVIGIAISVLFSAGLFLLVNAHTNSQAKQLALTVAAIKKSQTDGISLSQALDELENANAFDDKKTKAQTIINQSLAVPSTFNQLTVTGPSTLDGTVTIKKDLDLGGALNVAGSSNLDTALAVAGGATLSGNTTVQGTTTIQDGLEVDGTTTLGSTLTETDPSGNASNVFTNMNKDGTGTLNSGAALTVAGATTIQDGFEVDGNSSLSTLTETDPSGNGGNTFNGFNSNGTAQLVSGNTLTVGGAASLADDLTVQGAVTLGTTLTQTPSGGNGNVFSDLNGDGTAQINSGNELAVTGATGLADDLTVQGAVTLGTTLTQTPSGGNGNVFSDLNGDGTAQINSGNELAVTGATGLADDLTVQGAVTLGTTLTQTQSGGSNGNSFSDLSSDGTTQMNSGTELTVANDTTLADDLAVQGAVSLGTTLTQTTGNSNGNVFSDLNGDGTAQINSGNELTVAGGTTLADDLQVNGATLLQSTLAVNGGMADVGDLTVTGAATFNDALTSGDGPSGTSSLGTVTINGTAGQSAQSLQITSGGLSVVGGTTTDSLNTTNNAIIGGCIAAYNNNASTYHSLGGCDANNNAIFAYGNISADGNINVSCNQVNIISTPTTFTPHCSDVAERYPSNQSLVAGEVVSIDPNNVGYVVASSTTNDNLAIGVVSTDPGLVIGNSDPGYPVALSGRVPVDVTNEGGVIAPGDYLTSSSTPGYAMKAATGDKIIGQAMQAFSGTTGQVIMFVNTSPGTNTLQLQVTQTPSQSSGDSFTSLNVSGPSTMTDLKVTGVATIANLQVAGLAIVQNITINGHIVGNNDTRGTVTVPAGSTTVQFTFTTPYTQTPVVVASPTNEAVLYSVNPSTTGFDITLPIAATTSTNFDFLVEQ